MDIGIIGAGHIGGNVARRLVLAGHGVVLSYSRSPQDLMVLAREIGPPARTGTPTEAAACPVVVFSVPWPTIDDALAAAGSLNGRIVIDTTNRYSDGDTAGTAAEQNASRMVGARYAKTFNTLTSGFQTQVAGRQGDDRVVQWVCGDDREAKNIVMGLVDDAGYAPVDLGGVATCSVMESPRRPGAVYGEEYHLSDAREVVGALRAGRAIPPCPVYGSP